MKNLFVPMIGMVLLASISGCSKKNDPVLENQAELITDAILELTPVGGGDKTILLFNDPDGAAGSKQPTITGGSLQANTTYSGTISLLNNTVSPPKNMTEEIKSEAADHLFCYTASGIEVSVEITDNDANALSVGLLSKWTVGSVKGKGTMKVVLKHQPKIKDGSSCALGDTDLEIDFPITIA